MDQKLYQFPTPKLTSGFGYFVSQDGYLDVVIVDAHRFVAAWLAEEKAENGCDTDDELKEKYNENARFMGGDDNPISPHHTSEEDAARRLNRYYEESQSPFDMPLVAFRTSDWARENNTTIDFNNGRYRLINHFKAGALAIPVQLCWSDDTQAFKQQFEAKNHEGITIAVQSGGRYGSLPKLGG